MKFTDKLKNIFLFNNKYKTNSEAIIIACYFNPQRNPHRLAAFRVWYDSIKHLNHKIVECVIEGSTPELVHEFPSLHIHRVYTKNLLWHKEALLNGLINGANKISDEFKYIFWVDADVIFTNKNWLVEAVEDLQINNLVQPFEYCIHLDEGQLEPSFSVEYERPVVSDPRRRHSKMWRSFGSNHAIGLSNDQNYDKHGHVGFAWGARREVLEAVPLYDRALVGGADHIIAHAGAGQINHSCIAKSFTDDIDAVNKWSKDFYAVVKGKIGYVSGDLYHIWHGDIAKRQYLKRIQDFTPETKKITEKDKNGLYVTNDDSYVKQYFNEREVKESKDKLCDHFISLTKTSSGTTKIPLSKNNLRTKREELKRQYPDRDDSFIESLLIGYITDDAVLGMVLGGNPMGAIVGDMLNTNDEISKDDIEPLLNDYSETSQSDSTEINNDNFS